MPTGVVTQGLSRSNVFLSNIRLSRSTYSDMTMLQKAFFLSMNHFIEANPWDLDPTRGKDAIILGS